jgi:hypothetical protein
MFGDYIGNMVVVLLYSIFFRKASANICLVGPIVRYGPNWLVFNSVEGYKGTVTHLASLSFHNVANPIS